MTSPPRDVRDLVRSFTVEGYRRFVRFECTQMTRVNVIVGENDAGKSSLLEAMDIALADVPGEVLKRHLERRGEVARPGSLTGEMSALAAHAFHGHVLRDSARIELRADAGHPRIVEITYSEGEHYRRHFAGIHGDDEAREVLPRQVNPFLEVRGGRSQRSEGLPELYQVRDGVIGPPFWGDGRPRVVISAMDRSRLLGIGPAPDAMNMVWRGIALRREAFVLRCLQRFTAEIEGVNFVPAEPPFFGGEFRVKLRRHAEPVPLGSLGGGTVRLVQLAMFLAANAGGELLVDEVDHGLHYRRMPQLWRMLIESAVELDVQIIATTHSLDCLHALGDVLATSPHLAREVSLHRLDDDAVATVDYVGDEIAEALRLDVEVR